MCPPVRGLLVGESVQHVADGQRMAEVLAFELPLPLRLLVLHQIALLLSGQCEIRCRRDVIEKSSGTTGHMIERAERI